MWVKWDECQYWLDWQPLASKVQNNIIIQWYWIKMSQKIVFTYTLEAICLSRIIMKLPVGHLQALHLYITHVYYTCGVQVRWYVWLCMCSCVFWFSPPAIPTQVSNYGTFQARTPVCFHIPTHFTVSLEGAILCFVSHHFSSKLTVGHNR